MELVRAYFEWAVGLPQALIDSDAILYAIPAGVVIGMCICMYSERNNDVSTQALAASFGLIVGGIVVPAAIVVLSTLPIIAPFAIVIVSIFLGWRWVIT